MRPRIKKKQSGGEVDPSFERVVTAFAGDPDVKRGRMFSSENVLSVNGKIFALLTRGMFVVKLQKERVDELVRRGVGVNWGPSPGRIMKEWVIVQDGKASWVGIAKEAYQFVSRGKS